MEETGILIDNVDRFSKRGPRLSEARVHVTGGMDVRAGFMDGAVDDEAGGIDCDSVSADDLTLFVNPNHVAGLEHAEVLAKAILLVSANLNTFTRDNNSSRVFDLRVDPKGVRFDRVSDRDVSSCAFCEPLAGKHPERAGHVFELPLALLVQVGERGNAGKLVSASG
jgi:hypothetical protein